MMRPGIESRSPGPLANILPTRLMVSIHGVKKSRLLEHELEKLLNYKMIPKFSEPPQTFQIKSNILKHPVSYDIDKFITSKKFHCFLCILHPQFLFYYAFVHIDIKFQYSSFSLSSVSSPSSSSSSSPFFLLLHCFPLFLLLLHCFPARTLCVDINSHFFFIPVFFSFSTFAKK